MNEQTPSRQLVEQRVRNRVIEWLEVLVEYESDPPWFDLTELLNQWEDWNPHPLKYPPPAYTLLEAEKLTAVAACWEAFCQATPQRIKHEQSELRRPEWSALVLSGQAALTELNRRGRLKEDVEIGRSQGLT